LSKPENYLALAVQLDQPLSMQAMRLEHRPVRPVGLDLYEAWKRLNHDPPKE